ncbi:MAG: aspartate-semialdehyde dehydrogenase [Chlamydiales bacterium]
MSFAPGLTHKIPVAVYGATGAVGQRFVCLLAQHPWFDVVALCASQRRVGKRYGESVDWLQGEPIPAHLGDLVLQPSEPRSDCPLVFSALDARTAGELERSLAATGALVVTNASAHRMDADVPLLVPEVNPEHLELLPESGGAILANPNCSSIGLSLALAPLERALGVKRVQVVTLQAASGAGHPGVPSLDLIDNVIPFIAGEEEKLETEVPRIFGRVQGGLVQHHDLVVSAQCNRVPVVDGHVLSVSVELEQRADEATLRGLWQSFKGVPQEHCLPSAPERPTVFLPGPAVPQPRLHRDTGAGMSVLIGALKPCSILDWRFVTLSHNTIRGAAGGALLAAELAVVRQVARFRAQR